MEKENKKKGQNLKGENKDGVEMEEFSLHKFLYILILRSYTWAMEQSLIVMRERWQNENQDFFLLLMNKAGLIFGDM